MSSIPKSGSSEIDLTSAFQAVFGSGARKQLAQEACVSPDAVKRWLAGHWPEARRHQFTEILNRHIERKQRQLAEIQAKLL